MAYGGTDLVSHGGEVNIFVGDAQTHKKCPDCAEHIQAEARKCRYCSRLFTQDEIDESLQLISDTTPTVAESSKSNNVDALEVVNKFVSKFTTKIKDVAEERELIGKALAADVTEETHTNCNKCQEKILKTASICRFCQSNQKGQI